MLRKDLVATVAAVLLAGCGSHKPADPARPGSGSGAATTPPAPVHEGFADLAPVDVEPLRADYTPDELAAACAALQQTADGKLAAVVALADDQRTFDNTPAAIEQIETDLGVGAARLGFLKEIHTDAKVRDAAAACEESSSKYDVAISARKDLYLAMKGWQDHAGKTQHVDAQDQRLVDLAMRDFRRAGLELSDDDRAKLVQMRQRIAELETKFSANLDNDSTTITATAKELAGLPKDWIASHAKSPDGKGYVITTKYPDYYPIMESSPNAALRRREQVAFTSRGMPENIQLLDEAIALRADAAHRLGYPTHADFVDEVQMAKNAKTAIDFESRLRAELKPRLDADTRKMQALKAKDTRGKDTKINSWDWRYYLKQIQKTEYALDDEQVRAYFPADKALAGMFAVYARLFNISFKEIPNPAPWADGVTYYEIHDEPSGRLLAKFYVDLYPRPGKYGHAASFDIGLAREVAGGYQIPLSALVVNFNPPAGGKPSHLSVDEVDTLFHEFGHIMHMSLTEARYASLAGAHVARDFVEAPSQMLENWVFEPEVLAMISQDPADPSRSIPDDLVKKVIATRTFDSGVKYTRQVFLGTFDLDIHTHDALEADATCRKDWEDIVGFAEDPDEHFCAGFGHMMGGYDAGYYGYLWSLVFASDMFTRFQHDGVLNAATGRAYREAILAKGRTEEPDALLREFLGREPNEQAFLKLAGIESP